MTVTGAVLAGGESSRFGRDKCSLTFGQGGADILSRSARLLRRVVPDVLVAGRVHAEFPYLLDDVPGAGPVGAVTTVLRHTGKACYALSSDLPFMDEKTLRLLLAVRNERSPETFATLFVHGETGKKENLVGIYEPSALPYFESCLGRGLLKLSLIVPERFCCFVPVPAGAEGVFFNLNTPDDAEKARAALADDETWGG